MYKTMYKQNNKQNKQLNVQTTYKQNKQLNVQNNVQAKQQTNNNKTTNKKKGKEIMAKIKYVAPIKSVSGKLSKDSKVIYMVRRAATSNKAMQENPCYSSTQGVRSTPYSEAEKAAHVRFGKICAETTKRLNDASKKDADMAAFKAQTQYPTLRQYVWHVVAATVA